MTGWHQALLRLQDVDHRLLTVGARSAEIEVSLGDHRSLVEATRSHETSRAAADAARRRQQELEFELGRIQTKLLLTEEKLYSGRVTNARELQDLQAESESLKRHRSALEDEVLEAMVQREEADATLKDAEHRLKTAESEAKGKEASLSTEQATLRAERSALQEELGVLRASIPAAILDTYDYLKPRTAGIPVAIARGDVCSVCGTEILANTLRKLRAGEEAACDSCRRLLVREP